jgi:opacity protein-like surface antigen
MPRAAPPGRAIATARSMCLRLMILKDWRPGWTAGAGIEWALWNSWSIRLEYDYYGFGTRGVTFIDNVSATVGPLDIKQNIQVVKLGVNLHIFAGSGAPLGW